MLVYMLNDVMYIYIHMLYMLYIYYIINYILYIKYYIFYTFKKISYIINWILYINILYILNYVLYDIIYINIQTFCSIKPSTWSLFFSWNQQHMNWRGQPTTKLDHMLISSTSMCYMLLDLTWTNKLVGGFSPPEKY
jgi:hypothetical protein